MTSATRDIPTVDRSLQMPWRGVIAVSHGTRLDIQYCALLLALTAIMVLPGSLSMPMELWDESRNATNAMEIAKHGNWMVPTFGYMPDHWNTKPPLLIWIMAALLKTGMNPMLAVRLPSVAATMGSVLLVYLACRLVVQDRLAGVLGGLLVICTVLFMGDHVGRTGDYDALLSFLSLGFVLCTGRYIDADTHRSGGWVVGKWIALGGALLLLSLFTKGVAAGMAVPGLLAYALVRHRLFALLRDWRLWASMAAVIAVATGWLALREQLDPGYLAVMWYNDVGGRMANALDRHSEGPLFYVMILGFTVQPAILLLPTLVSVRRDRDPARHRLCLLTILTAVSWVVVLSCAGTKIYWYAAPAVPLLAIAVAVGTTTFLRGRKPPLSSLVVIRPIIAALLITFWYLNVRAPGRDTAYADDRVWYGPFLDKARYKTPLDGAVIIDPGIPNDAGFPHYNPVARFFAEDAERHGEHIEIVAPGAPIANHATIISCDLQVRDSLRSQRAFATIQSDAHCVLGRFSIAPEG